MTSQSDPLEELRSAGQSIWLDYISRGLLTSGELARMVREEYVSGVTSNPTIFQKAIAGSTDYDEVLKKLAERGPVSGYDAFILLGAEDSGWLPTSSGRSTTTRVEWTGTSRSKRRLPARRQWSPRQGGCSRPSDART